MRNIINNSDALTNFDRFVVAVNGGFVSKAPLERRVAEIAKTESADSFRYPDDQNTPPYRGFFVRAVLHTKASINLMAWKKRVIGSREARCNSYNPMDWLKL